MTRKNSVVIFALLLSLLASCKKKEVKDIYALPPDWSGSLDAKLFDFDVDHVPKNFSFGNRNPIPILDIETSNAHCGRFDFQNTTVTVHPTKTKKYVTLKFFYLGKNRFVAINSENRGFFVIYKHSKGFFENFQFFFYPLSLLDEVKEGTEEIFIASSSSETKVETLDECEKGILEQQEIDKRIDEEFKQVSPDLAPP
ncbi:hypothetical protein EHO59_12880 [Leptospira semungkisensis]|uniref:Lipoprotein n=1 Tax=Leptospira semungkisensis TaxID=2484985 RepID=A0A4R9FQG7_9LEPT|nr:hypothetical protein [Leptospira semungkisensis]TGK00821.1 hypothetical protein EHO59_12880 [Leptospira semungkisensis]